MASVFLLLVSYFIIDFFKFPQLSFICFEIRVSSWSLVCMVLKSTYCFGPYLHVSVQDEECSVSTKHIGWHGRFIQTQNQCLKEQDQVLGDKIGYLHDPPLWRPPPGAFLLLPVDNCCHQFFCGYSSTRFFSVNLHKIFVSFVVCGFISYLSSAFLHEMKWHFLPLTFFTFDLEELTMSVGADQGFTGGASGKEPPCQCRRCKRHRFEPWVAKIP